MSDELSLPDGACWLDEVSPEPSVVTIGNFDGVHRGHQILLHRTVDAALAREVRAVAVTFHPHPAAVLRPGSEPASLGSIQERAHLLLDAGIDLVVVVPFTAELSRLEPEGFIRHVLVDRLRAVRVVVGSNFRFGRKAAGDVVALVEFGEPNGFDVEAVAVREDEGRPISSSAIRAALTDGEVAVAASGLGRPYRLTAPVVAGDGRGRTIGVPTANLDVPAGRLVPAHGVYAGWATAPMGTWPCVTNVGVRPTFGTGAPASVEAHLLEATDVDLYGVPLGVTFEHRLRGERRFDGVDELVAQIRADIAQARSVLGLPVPDEAD